MPSVESERRTTTIHGHEVTYRMGGEGPVVLLIHGMAGSSSTWVPALEHLAPHLTYIAPDLPGHGRSAKPRSDYSLGAHASFLRDLLVTLGHERATIVGQSLGGGVAMQFAYQFPQRVERLALVGAGGLGEEVNPVLRLLALPGVDLLLPFVFQPWIRELSRLAGEWTKYIGMEPTTATTEMWRAYASLTDPETRSAFVHTLKAVIDHRGQRVSAHDKLYLAQDLPTLIVWGSDDPIIPVSHAQAALESLPGSRVEILEGLGHFPHSEDPYRFSKLLVDFVETTEAAHLDAADLARRLTPAG
ncbi:MAG: alpha/beta fold hydrolase [Microthrixaceae bacterium]